MDLTSTTLDSTSEGSSSSQVSPSTGSSTSTPTTSWFTTTNVLSTTATGDPLDLGGHEPLSCHVWLKDCPQGQKCYYDTSSEVYVCTDMVPAPAAPGQPCEIFETIDSCDAFSHCRLLDETTGIGTCMPTCSGSPGDFTCPEPMFCQIYDEPSDVMAICLLPCDPLMAECPPGASCLPFVSNYTCQNSIQPPKVEGEPCLGFECKNGLVCASDASMDCVDDSCCTPYCDLNAPDPCPMDMQICVQYSAGEGWEHIGFCRLPP